MREIVAMASVNQSDNVAQGDIIAGDKIETTFNISPTVAVLNELSLLYAKMKNLDPEDDSGGVFCEQLEHYLSSEANSDVRGLEAKLTESGRQDLIETATRLKEKAVKSVMRRQSSRTAQRVYTLILSELHTNFELLVTPAIQDGATRADVDLRILNALNMTKNALGENALEFTARDLLGLLYFLGGNCHIRWDKC